MNLSLAATADMDAVWAWCVKSALAVHSCRCTTGKDEDLNYYLLFVNAQARTKMDPGNKGMI